MGKNEKILDAVVRVHNEVDVCRDADWERLGEKLNDTILKKCAGLGFTPEQEAALIAVCQETYYSASVVARAYAFRTAEVLASYLGQ